MSSVLTQASREFMTRPDDQRFGSLDDICAHFRSQRACSREEVVSTSIIEARPVAGDDEMQGLVLLGVDENPALMTHYSFGQVATLAKVPVEYARRIPSDLVAENLNYGLKFARERDSIGSLTRRNGAPLATLAAATGPTYGRIWNDEFFGEIRSRFGDGVTGDFTAPGIFGKALDPTDTEEYRKQACFFASEKDGFVFLCDEKNRIEVPNRRNGETGSLARGFFGWNSEVGAATAGVAMFYFDYVCMNRMVWGVEGFEEIRIRHTAGAPGRYLAEVVPVIEAITNASTRSFDEAIAAAQLKQIAKKQEEVIDWLGNRLGSRTKAEAINLQHFVEEGKPIETLFDASVGISAYAREKPNQDDRIELEREAGRVLQLATK